MDDNNTNEVDFTVFLQQYKDKLPDGFQLRPLEPGDYDKNYIHVLSQLTSTGQVSREQFVDRFNAMTASNLYYVAVIEDLNQSFIVASITLVLELKFIHECGMRGRVEDVVVDKAYRGRQFASLLNRCVADLARELGVYKLSLECTESLSGFYEQFGFKTDGNRFLVQRFCD